MKLLERELAEIRTTWGALKGDGSAPPRQPAMTIKEMIRQIVRGRPDGLAAGEILREIESRFGVGVERTSLSPQLSRLRAAGEVTLQDGRWYSTQIPLTHLVVPHHGHNSGRTPGGGVDDLL